MLVKYQFVRAIALSLRAVTRLLRMPDCVP
jgi:hypothetical protein